MALSIDDLRSFLLVAQERSVTRAAGQMKVSQQSVSERIRRLEGRIGVQLFSRMPHGMQPTPAGYRLVPYAAQCIALVDQAMAVIDDDDLLRLRVQRSASAAVMGYLDNLTAASHMEVSTGDDAAEMLAAVADGTIDVAVGVFADKPAASPSAASSAPVPAALSDVDGSASGGPGSNGAGGGLGANGADHPVPGDFEAPVASAEVRIEGLFTDPVVWVVRPDHPLASREAPISLMELSAIPTGGAGPGGVDEGGLRVVARSAVADELASGDLVELPVDQAGWVVPISMAYRASDHDRPAVVTLRRAVTEGHALASGRQPAAKPSPAGGADQAA